MTVIPVANLAISIGLGVVLKPMLIKHLTNNGYQLTETIQASKPWYFDKEVYKLNVTNISSAHSIYRKQLRVKTPLFLEPLRRQDLTFGHFNDT